MPDKPQSWPLTESHCDCLDRVIESAARHAELVRKCKACGLNVEEFERENAEHERLAKAIKAQFFPDRA